MPNVPEDSIDNLLIVPFQDHIFVDDLLKTIQKTRLDQATQLFNCVSWILRGKIIGGENKLKTYLD